MWRKTIKTNKKNIWNYFSAHWPEFNNLYLMENNIENILQLCKIQLCKKI